MRPPELEKLSKAMDDELRNFERLTIAALDQSVALHEQLTDLVAKNIDLVKTAGRLRGLLKHAEIEAEIAGGFLSGSDGASMAVSPAQAEG